MPISTPSTLWLKWLLAFIAALLVGTLLGSLVQTQFNLLAIQSMGFPVPFEVRLMTSAQDLLFFGPVFAALFGGSFLVSQPVSLLINRWLPPVWHPPLCAAGAAAGLGVTLKLVDTLAPMPTLIAATRSASGTLALVACAALAGWLFARWSPNRPAHPVRSPATACTVLLLVGVASLPSEPAQADEPVRYRIETLAEGLEHPWSLAFLPDGGLLVTERPGRLRHIDAGGHLQPPISGVPEVHARGQSGLFDVLLAKDFEHSRQLYLSYACGTPSANHTCLARARWQGSALRDREEVFRTRPAKAGSAHFGGRLAWLEDDTLILTLGDGFDYREQAQNVANPIGGTVRLNPDGSIPADNPFRHRADAAPELYTLGHRNVQGLFFDAPSGVLFSHEHGPKGGDEVNVLVPGENYGWPAVTHGLDYTGARVSPYEQWPGIRPPLWHWTPSIAPSGLTRYSGPLFPEWEGSLLIGGLASRQVHRLTLTNGVVTEQKPLFGELRARIRDVRVGPEGAVYLLTDSSEGRVLRVTPD